MRPHWCTFSRFGNKDHPCVFGCGFPADRISHTAACPKFLEVFFGVCGVDTAHIDFDELALLSGAWIGSSVHRARFILLATHICFLCFHTCRHGTLFSARLVLHKLALYTRRHAKTALFVRHFKYYERKNASTWWQVLGTSCTWLENPYVLPHFSDVAFSIALYHVLLVVFVSCHSHVRHFKFYERKYASAWWRVLGTSSPWLENQYVLPHFSDGALVLTFVLSCLLLLCHFSCLWWWSR